MNEHLGKSINNYKLTKSLGEGSYAEVYLGEHIESDGYAAIKILHTHINESNKRDNFLKEAHFIAELKHPHIVHLINIGFTDNTPFIVMSFAAKGNLRQKHAEGSLLQEETIIHYTQQLASALQYAHNKNIIHCDVKPENILLDDENQLILSDFGIANIVQSTRLQTTHNPEGTPTYMAPEQFRGKPSKKSDQYALGVIVYEWLCGELPFKGKNFLELMNMHQNVKPISLRTKIQSIPQAVEVVVMRALEKDPKKRFDTIQDFANALQEAFRTSNISRKPLVFIVCIVSLILILLLLAVLFTLPLTYYAHYAIFFLITFILVFSGLFSFIQLDAVRFSNMLKILRKSRIALEPQQAEEASPRQLYTALDIGTSFAKALIIEVLDDQATVLGAGRYPQSYAHMSEGIVTDISGVIANCNEALIMAEKSAGNIVAPAAIIGIAGEMVKGSSITIQKQRQKPTMPITPEELEGLMTSAQNKLLKNARDRIVVEIGDQNIEVRLTNSAVISVRIDGQIVANPVGFRGRLFTITMFSAFAPLMHLGAIETVAQGLDLTLVTIVTEPYALGRCLSTNAEMNTGAIFIDIGGGTTDIALVRQAGIEETRMFALGGRNFTRRLATYKGISLKEAEKLKINYSTGNIKGSDRDELQTILAPECKTWMDSVELLIEELSKGELLPPAIYLVGGGSALPDLHHKLENFPWTERLPFARQPIIETVQPEMVSSISDPHELLKNAQDITPMALAYQAVELQNENNVLEQILYRVIHGMLL